MAKQTLAVGSNANDGTWYKIIKMKKTNTIITLIVMASLSFGLNTNGAMSLNNDFDIILANKTTNKIFHNTKKIIENNNFLEIFPEWEKIFLDFKDKFRNFRNK